MYYPRWYALMEQVRGAYSLINSEAKRTLKRFSSEEESTMINKVHANYFKYYYRAYKCADQIVTASLDGNSNVMTNGITIGFINIDFTGKEQVTRNRIVLPR